MFTFISIRAGIVLLCCFATCSPRAICRERSQEKKQASPIATSQPTAVTFHDEQGGNGLIEGRIPFSFHDYKSSDGIALSIFTEKRVSFRDARKAMQAEISKAARIVTRGSKWNRRGQRMGERAVLIRRTKDSYQGEAVIIWTEGRNLHRIESPSLTHALLFEK